MAMMGRMRRRRLATRAITNTMRMLRAYANRSMVLAMVFGVIALSSFAFAVYVRLQPPTVIRVDSEGEAAIVGGTPAPGHTRGLTFTASAADAAPTDVESKAVVRRFLDHYLNYTPGDG